MDSSIYVTSPAVALPQSTSGQSSESPSMTELLRQILETQREQLAFMKGQAANQDAGARWRAFLGRWDQDFPGVGQHCKEVLPIIERAYLRLIQELTERLREDADGLDSDFALAEFLDRYGMRLGQLGGILSQLGPLADAAAGESPS
jgi:hypothetical protein